ncbi:hypothetical protein Q7M85_00455 [Candidatus Liberibacter asiaticus]
MRFKTKQLILAVLVTLLGSCADDRITELNTLLAEYKEENLKIRELQKELYPAISTLAHRMDQLHFESYALDPILRRMDGPVKHVERRINRKTTTLEQ